MAVTDAEIVAAGIVRWEDAAFIDGAEVPAPAFIMAAEKLLREGANWPTPDAIGWRTRPHSGGYDVYIAKYGNLLCAVCYSTVRGAWL